MSTILVNPLDETPRDKERAAKRLDTLAGATVGLLDISKPGGSLFLDRLEKELVLRYRVGGILREVKPTYSKPAPEALLRRLREAGAAAVIEALAD